MSFFPLTPDRVAVFGDGFLQLFPNARPVHARVIERSQLMDHPLETGQIITDYAIILPIEIELTMIVESENYRDTYEQIRTNYLNKQKLTVQTNAANYPNMVIADMPHDERPEMFDALGILLRLRQVQLVPDPNTYDPAAPGAQDTQVLGQQNGYVITGVQTENGLATIPSGTGDVSYSSVPPQGTISGVQTANGLQTIALPETNGITVTGVQTVTSQQSLVSVF